MCDGELCVTLREEAEVLGRTGDVLLSVYFKVKQDFLCFKGVC